MEDLTTKALECLEERLTLGKNSNLILYWDKAENYIDTKCVVAIKMSNKKYIKEVLKREVKNPVCKDGYYTGGSMPLDAIPIMYDKLQQYEDLGDIDTIKQTLMKTQESEKENAEYKKVLEIIFEKNVITLLLELAETVDEYNERIVSNNGKLTQEEFELLKRRFEK